MAKGIDSRSYEHEGNIKLNKEIERIDVKLKETIAEAGQQKSVKKVSVVTDKIPQGIFHIDRDGNVYIRTKLGLKQLQFV